MHKSHKTRPTPERLKKLVKAADDARQRVSGYSDDRRADLESRGRAQIKNGRAKASVCVP